MMIAATLFRPKTRHEVIKGFTDWALSSGVFDNYIDEVGIVGAIEFM